ncbi:MAG: hypothetical protein ACO3UU_12765, partial [Minisyncoccia bacterium]
YLTEQYDDILKISTQCKNYLTMLRYYDLKEVVEFITYINKFITPWMSGPLWGIVVSLIVFLSFLPFIGILQFGIRIITNLIKYYSLKFNLVKLNLKSTKKETLSL